MGAFVELVDPPYAEWGVGKLVMIAGQLGTVQFFDSPDPGSHVTIEFPIAKIRSVSLRPQTRIYRRHSAGGRWQVGRVLQHDGERTLLVQYPNGDSVNVEACDVEVRWNRPIQDPLPYLIAEATETPFLADARSAFAHVTSLQYAACWGMASVLSSSIELVDYQLNVVRRILTDPIQRYLLADEVGLGKTIEACLVIRQYMLDDPLNAKVLVVAPRALVQQWREELTRRFALDAFLDDYLHVVGHDQIDRIARLLPDAGLIVVDEAHHLSRKTEGGENLLYELLRRFAPSVPRLLLLSATPVLSDSAGFLRVMHLLDSAVFPLDDLEGFEHRIKSRQFVAELVAILLPQNVWSLPAELDRLSAEFNTDPLLDELISDLRVILDRFPEEDDEALIEALSALRMHLAETYRLHRRVLRNRRVAVPWATIQRSGLERFEFEHERNIGATFMLQLEDLRLHLGALTDLSPSVRTTLLDWGVRPNSCMRVEEWLISLGVEDIEARRLAKVLEGSARTIRELDSRFLALRDAVSGLLKKAGQQIVVFCDSAEDADRAVEMLGREFGRLVQRHQVLDAIPDQEDLEDDEQLPWKAFLTLPSTCRVLVCDAGAEEGVNLHGGSKVALHFDLPVSPNRIEQRLGRLDRFGTGDPVRSIVLVDRANLNEKGWLDVLDTAWEIFDRSVASLQYLIEESTQGLINDWFDLGALAFAPHVEALAGQDGRIRKELRRIDQQDALDSLEQPGDDLLDDLTECDQQWEAWRDGFDTFAVQALRFVRRTEATRPNGDSIFRVGYAYRGDQQTLLPLSRFVGGFLQAMDLEAPDGSSQMPLTHRYAFKRQTVNSREGLRDNIRLLRIGDPLITALERFAAVDDRGRAFGLWRVRQDSEIIDPSGADLFFRFDFVVHPGEVLSSTESVSETHAYDIQRSALSRSARASMPPLFFTVWVSGSGHIVSEPPKALLEKYKDKGQRAGSADFNLNPDRWRVLHQRRDFAWLQNWDELCSRARDVAQQYVLVSPKFNGHLESALVAVARQHKLRLAQGRARASRMSGVAAATELRELETDDCFYRNLATALRNPILRLECVGAIFLANHSPFTSC